MKTKKLNPINLDPKDIEEIELQIKDLLTEEIYQPIVDKFFAASDSIIKNSRDDLISAISSGKIYFYRGYFKGQFNSRLSRELRKIGAKWDRKHGGYKILSSDLGPEINLAISASASRFSKMVQGVDKILRNIFPEKIADKLNLTGLIDSKLLKLEKSFEKSIDGITVAPKFTKDQRAKIAEEYSNNMKLSIKDWSEKEIKKLRGKIKGNVIGGRRYESMVSEIEKSYGVSRSKAKFLARQETNLLVTKFRETRYTSAGITEYEWKVVVGSKNHPVRPMHKKLDGSVQEWSNPPITDLQGNRNHPGEDYNCIPEDAEVVLHSPAKKAFRRWYDGELTEMITSSDKRLRVTPNHPVLTTRGWISAHLVKAGDYLVEAPSEFFDRSIADPKSSDVMTAKQVFSSLKESGSLQWIAGRTSWFHGDSVTKNVDVIRTNWMLMNEIKSFIFKIVHQNIFALSNLFTFRLSHFMGDFVREGFSSQSFISRFSKFLSVFKRGLGHPKKHRIAFVSDRNVIRDKNPSNWTSGNFKFFSDSFLAHAIDIKPDNFTFVKVESVVSYPWSGFVHNFETLTGWYSSVNLIVHNCRCYARPIVRFK